MKEENTRGNARERNREREKKRKKKKGNSSRMLLPCNVISLCYRASVKINDTREEITRSN